MFEKLGVEVDVPAWSGEFLEIGNGLAIMRVHGTDMRQHFPPPGWEAVGHNTFDDGSFETYIFHRFNHDHDHFECPECGV